MTQAKATRHPLLPGLSSRGFQQGSRAVFPGAAAPVATLGACRSEAAESTPWASQTSGPMIIRSAARARGIVAGRAKILFHITLRTAPSSLHCRKRKVSFEVNLSHVRCLSTFSQFNNPLFHILTHFAYLDGPIVIKI